MTLATRNAHRASMIAVGLALVALPATAAVQAHGGGAQDARAAVVVDATVVAAPAVGADGGEVDALADTAAAAVDVMAVADGDRGEHGVDAAAAEAAVPADESGSTEAATVQRACDAPADPHYVPSSGQAADECYDADGTFRPGRTYTATHHTNDVRCGSENVLVPADAAGVYVSGNGGGGAEGGDGYVSACSDDAMPINGRATARGEVDPSGDLAVSATADGDKDNPEETTQGWITATITPAGPEYRCGKSYAEGGRANSDAPTGEDTADECG